MLLVIVGAGASFDSDPDCPPDSKQAASNEIHRMPLADQLFDSRFAEILAKYDHLLGVAPRLRHRNNQSIEDVLAAMVSEQKPGNIRLKQLTEARFYIKAVVQHCESNWCKGQNKRPTNMMWLVDEIENARDGRERPMFATFNYDGQVDDALRTHQKPFETMDDYIGENRSMLFKLHGSIDWVRLSVDQFARRTGRGEEDVLQQLSELLPREGTMNGAIVKSGSVGVDFRSYATMPAIAIPVKEKIDFECPKDHVETMVLALPDVTAILAIGWRGQERHFLKQLKAHVKRPVHLTIVSGSAVDGQTTFQNICDNLDSGVYHKHIVATEGFTKFMKSKELHHFLGSAWHTEKDLAPGLVPHLRSA